MVTGYPKPGLKFMETTREIYEQIKIWVAALRSGKYNQTVGKLQDDIGYCCLGVACKIFIPADKLSLKNDDKIFGRLPDDQPNAPYWLLKFSNDFKRKVDEFPETLNDRGRTFSEIADLIEKHYITPYTSIYE